MTGTNATEPPSYPHWGQGAAAEDPVGCLGAVLRAEGDEVDQEYEACLAHLSDSDRRAYLEPLRPGSDPDHSGTTFRLDLLSELLVAVLDPESGRPKFGLVVFDRAAFKGDAVFHSAALAVAPRAAGHPLAAARSAWSELHCAPDRRAQVGPRR